MGRTYAANWGNNYKSALNSLERYDRGADSNPARVKAQEEVHTTGDIYFHLYREVKIRWVWNDARVPVQLNAELNWEGVELSFD
jgi:hypothetical protein